MDADTLVSTVLFRTSFTSTSCNYARANSGASSSIGSRKRTQVPGPRVRPATVKARPYSATHPCVNAPNPPSVCGPVEQHPAVSDASCAGQSLLISSRYRPSLLWRSWRGHPPTGGRRGRLGNGTGCCGAAGTSTSGFALLPGKPEGGRVVSAPRVIVFRPTSPSGYACRPVATQRNESTPFDKYSTIKPHRIGQHNRCDRTEPRHGKPRREDRGGSAWVDRPV